MSLETASLLPGLDSEITRAQRDTIWSATGGSYLKGVWIEFPYLYIPSFAEVKKQTPPRQPPPRPSRSQVNPSTSTVGRPSRQSRNSANTINANNSNENSNNNTSSKEPHFLVQLPPPIVIKEDGSDPWTLHCVCEEKTGTGLLVGCEKCGCWQHAICVGLNMHTIPENYICELCGNRPIRCKCNNNLNYRFSIIQCSQCGYYVHRRCVGLHYGPLPRGDFICNFCGKSKFTYAKTRLSHSLKLIPNEDATFTFTQEKVESIPSYFLNGPFNDFLTIDIYEAKLKAREFCESFYDRFRSFFFICHPLNPNVISRKKRNNLFTSFINGTEQLCHLFYNFDHQTFLNVFDNLIYNDIYSPFTEPLQPYDMNCEITENTRFELARITNAVKFQSIPPYAKIEISKTGGLIARTELRQDQFIMLCDGLIGDLEEFNYDNGVNSSFFQIADTRLVLDTSHVLDSPLHSIQRSMSGNVVLKIIYIGDDVKCGLFVGRATLSAVKADDVVIMPGERLLFGIDFMPAVLEDISKWIGYHCPDVDEHGVGRPSSRDERERERDSHTSRQSDAGISGTSNGRGRPKPQGKYKAKKGDRDRDRDSSLSAAYSTKKPARNTKLKKRSSGSIVNQSLELSLFDLFDTESPSNFLFTVTDDVEEYKRRMEEAALHPQKAQQVPRRAHKSEISSRHSTPNKSEASYSNSNAVASASHHHQHHSNNNSGAISSSSSASSISQSARERRTSKSANAKNDSDDSDDNDDNDNSYYSEDDADEYIQSSKSKVSDTDSKSSSAFIPRSGSAPNAALFEKGSNATPSSNQDNAQENQARQHHHQRKGRSHLRSHGENSESVSQTASASNYGSEPSSSPAMQVYNARDILKLTDAFKKEIKEVESTNKYAALSIGDPIEVMKSLLNDDT
ncbi:hypothetical protein M9Y10_038349 [Tritrichomonas musculus]|uniref:Zinc finger PHD-type domain-containing protein n=1 Tax=Tritrichomonas musculus TaxID=1915356 RepID=A0ABR2K8V9_9EUKA